MPTPTKGHRLGGSPAHERHILANLATALFQHGRITTTEAKAKRLRPVAERLITFAKRGDLHARRHVLTVVTDKGVVHQLFTEIAPRVLRAGRRLHPDHQDRPAQGRQRGDGRHRAGPRRAGRGQAAPPGRGRAAGRRHSGRPGQGRRRGRGSRRGDRGRRPRPTRRPRPARPPTSGRGRGRGGRRSAEAAAGRGRRGRRGRRARGTTSLPGTPDPGARPRWTRSDEPRTVRLRVDLAYDGSAFSGWAAPARQADRRRTCWRQRSARCCGCRPPPELTVAGRTDAGVHARGQVAHVDLPPRPWPRQAERAGCGGGWPGVLPADVRVRRAGRRPAGSTRGSPRCGAATPTGSATTRPASTRCARHDVLWHVRPLDVDAMNEAAAAAAGRARLRRLLQAAGGRDHHPYAAATCAGSGTRRASPSPPSGRRVLPQHGARAGRGAARGRRRAPAGRAGPARCSPAGVRDSAVHVRAAARPDAWRRSATRPTSCSPRAPPPPAPSAPGPR